MKRFVFLLLAAFILVTVLGNSFAEGTQDMNSYTITTTVQPGSSSAIFPGSDNTDIWGQFSYVLYNGDILYTPQFYIPERYFAYEMTATGSSSGTYTVKLMWHSYSEVATGTAYANGVMKKIDWISVDVNEPYCFKITNNSGSTISVTITYYSWT